MMEATKRIRVCALNEINLVKEFEVGTFEGIVIRSDDLFFACQRYCPHKGFPLDFGRLADKNTLHCTFHGSEFDLRTGKVTEPPAKEGICTFPVLVVDDQIYVEVPAGIGTTASGSK